jgi:hypothetical protein
MILRIVEFSDELQNYKFSKDEKIIALNTCAQSFLRKKKVDYKNSLDFFGTEGHIVVSRKSKNIMEEIKDFYNFKDKNSLNLSYESGFYSYLNFYIRHMLILLFIIDKVIKKYNPEKIIVSKSTPIKNFDYHWIKKDRLLGYLTKKYVAANNLKINIIEEDKKEKKSKSNFLVIKKYIKKLVFSTSFLYFKYFYNKKNIYFITNDNNNFKNVIDQVKMEKPELKPVFLNLSKKSIKRYKYKILKGDIFNLFFNNFLKNKNDNDLIKKSLNNFNNSLEENNRDKEINFLNVNLNNEIKQFVSSVMFTALSEFNAQAFFLEKVVKISNPVFMVSQHTHLLGCAFGELGIKYNIPTLVISHGSHISHDVSDAKYEWEDLSKVMINKNFRYVAAQNPHMLKFLKDNNYKNNQIIETGPLLYNKINYLEKNIKYLKKKIYKNHSNKKIIIHAGTPKMRGSNRLFVYETVDEYIKNINDMISVIKKKQDVFFVIKYRQNPRIALEDFKELIQETETCKIFHDGDFTDFLATADLMVSYSSTTIDEALYNKVPIVLYDPDAKYSHIPGVELEKTPLDLINSVFYCTKLSNFDSTISKTLENKKKILENNKIWSKHILDTSQKSSWLSQIIN